MRLDSQRIVEKLEGRFGLVYVASIGELLASLATRNQPRAAMARGHLEYVVAETMGVAEVLGATEVLQAAAGVLVDDEAAFRHDRRGLVCFRQSEAQDILPRVELQEAVDDMLARTPVTLRDAAQRTGREIARIYAEGHAIAFARAAEHSVTERVQAVIAQAMREGLGENEAVARIRENVDQVRQDTTAWTEAYARTAFRTNVSTAVTAGRFRQAQDPDVSALVPAFAFDAIGDADTRPNHEAADGAIWSVTNPVWQQLAPPLGFQCRCSVRIVTRPELRRMGRLDENGRVIESPVPAGAFPDPGFRHAGRPDLLLGATA